MSRSTKMKKQIRKKVPFETNGQKKRTKAKRRAGAVVLGLLVGGAAAGVGWMSKRKQHEAAKQQPFEGEDMVEHASRASFPASDAPSY